PTAVAAALGQVLGEALPALGRTVATALVAYALSVGLGVGLGLVIGARRFLGDVLSPFLLAAYGLPKILVLPWFVLILGTGEAPGVRLRPPRRPGRRDVRRGAGHGLGALGLRQRLPGARAVRLDAPRVGGGDRHRARARRARRAPGPLALRALGPPAQARRSGRGSAEVTTRAGAASRRGPGGGRAPDG